MGGRLHVAEWPHIHKISLPNTSVLLVVSARSPELWIDVSVSGWHRLAAHYSGQIVIKCAYTDSHVHLPLLLVTHALKCTASVCDNRLVRRSGLVFTL